MKEICYDRGHDGMCIEMEFQFSYLLLGVSNSTHEKTF